MSPARGPGPVSRAAAPRAGGRGLPVLLIAVLALMAAGRAADRATTIVGADLADGTGAPLRRANVRIVGDRIASVGDVKPQGSDTVVDGKGLVVAPGFIDIHNHSSSGLAADPAAETQIAQGITTVVVGPDGDSPWPIGDYLSERRSAPSAVNVASFVGHATVRRQVMKDDFKRPARADEIARMALLVDQGMREGATGLSSGLEYEVGGYAETAELIELAKVVARYGGVYMSHIRDEADKTFDALKEAIAIGEQAHVAVQISHIKLGTVGVWRRAAEAIALIEAAQQRGVDVTADAYPYNAWQSTITVLVPNKKYDDPPSVDRALADVGGAQNVLVVRHAAHPEYEFRTLDVIAAGQNRTPVDQFIQIVKDGGATVVCTSMTDEDIRAFYTRPWLMVGSDGGLANRHPRGAGTFPRVLGRYVRDQRWLTLPEAIRKMTSAPAARLRLEGLGQITVGAIADVVLFNAKTIVDRSTFTDPGVLPSGVEKVFVGGELAWDAGKPTGARTGKVLMSGHTPIDSDAGAYTLLPDWAQLPANIQLGEVPGMTIDSAGRIFTFNRAEPPIIEFDASGKVLKTWGEKMFVWPHGIRVDRDGFLWITDGRARNGIGQQVFKFTRDGTTADDARQERRIGRRPRHVQQPDRRRSRAQRRHLRLRRPRQLTHRQVLEGRDVHQGVGPARRRPRRVQRPAHDLLRFAGPSAGGRSLEPAHPDFRSGRTVPRSVDAVRIAERDLHRRRMTRSTWSTTTTRWRCSWAARKMDRSGHEANRCWPKASPSTLEDRSTSARP